MQREDPRKGRISLLATDNEHLGNLIHGHLLPIFELHGEEVIRADEVAGFGPVWHPTLDPDDRSKLRLDPKSDLVFDRLMDPTKFNFCQLTIIDQKVSS